MFLCSTTYAWLRLTQRGWAQLLLWLGDFEFDFLVRPSNGGCKMAFHQDASLEHHLQVKWVNVSSEEMEARVHHLLRKTDFICLISPFTVVSLVNYSYYLLYVQHVFIISFPIFISSFAQNDALISFALFVRVSIFSLASLFGFSFARLPASCCFLFAQSRAHKKRKNMLMTLRFVQWPA